MSRYYVDEILFPRNVKSKLEERKMTQKALAKKMYLSDSVISRKINGSLFNQRQLVDLCNILDCDLNELIPQKHFEG